MTAIVRVVNSQIVVSAATATALTAILLPQVAAAQAAQSAAEDARDLSQGYASDAAVVSGVNVPIYATRGSAEGATVAEAVTAIQLQGYAAAGDAPPAPYTEIDIGATDKPWHLKTNVNTRRWEQITDGLLDARRFGVVLDSSGAAAANTGYLQDLLDYCQEMAGGIGGRVPGNMYFDGQVINPAAVPIVVHGAMTFTGGGEAALVFGEADDRTIAARDLSVMSYINIERVTRDWSDVQAGIVFQNITNWLGWISVDSFYLGIDYRGQGDSAHYNDFFLKRINRAQIGVRIWSNTGNLAGSSNECNWHGGEFQSSASSADEIIGIQFRRDGTGTVINNHKFWGPSFELTNTGSGGSSVANGYSADGYTSIAISNSIHAARSEAPVKILSGDGLSNNLIEITFSDITNATLGSEILNPLNDAARLRLGDNIFRFPCSGPYGWGEPQKLGEVGRQHVVSQTPGATELGCKPPRGAIFLAEPTYKFVFHNSGVTLKSGSISTSTSAKIVFGMFFDLRTSGEDYNRKITVKVHAAAAGGRIAAVCFDASGNRLEGAEDCSLTWSATSGMFRQGADLTAISSETTVLFGMDVKYVVLGVGPGSAAGDFKKIEYFAPIGADIGVCYDPSILATIGVHTVNSVAVAPILDRDGAMATQAPTDPGAGNSYPVGFTVINADPAAGEAAGWTRGAAGWRPMANLG